MNLLDRLYTTRRAAGARRMALHPRSQATPTLNWCAASCANWAWARGIPSPNRAIPIQGRAVIHTFSTPDHGICNLGLGLAELFGHFDRHLPFRA